MPGALRKILGIFAAHLAWKDSEEVVLVRVEGRFPVFLCVSSDFRIYIRCECRGLIENEAHSNYKSGNLAIATTILVKLKNDCNHNITVENIIYIFIIYRGSQDLICTYIPQTSTKAYMLTPLFTQYYLVPVLVCTMMMLYDPPPPIINI